MTTTLYQSRKLYELGVRVKSLKVWGVMNESYRGNPRIADSWTDTGIYDVIYPAYNAEELSSMIRGDLEIVRREDETGYAYYTFGSFKDEDGIEYWGQVCGSTLTEALGNRLIHDIENGIITIEEINK